MNNDLEFKKIRTNLVPHQQTLIRPYYFISDFNL